MRVGLVGAGLIGRRRAEVVREFQGTDLMMVADIDAGRAMCLAGEMDCEATTDWQRVVASDDLDVVIVATSHKFLVPISIAALEGGKHVLCEKPGGRTPQEVQDTVDAAQRNRVKLKVGFNHRYHPAIEKAYDLFQRGRIGRLHFVRCRYGHGGRPGYDKEWRGDPDQAGGGELLDQGIHAMDLFRWFMGEFAEAGGFTGTYFWDIGSLEDNAFGLFRTSKGQIASLHASWTQWKNIFSFEIFGQDGYLIINGLGGSYGEQRLTVGTRLPESGSPEEQHFEFPGQDNSWYEEWKEFVSAIREDREPDGNGYDALQAMKMVYAVYEAEETGRLVKL